MDKKQVDILIVGGGLTGATLLLALQGLGYSSLLVESTAFSDKVNPDFDARSLALSPASKRILSALSVWDLMKEKASPIARIHVSDQGSFGVSRLEGDAQNSLGYVLEMQDINRALHQVLDKERVLAPAQLTSFDLAKQEALVIANGQTCCVQAKLVVAADGAESSMRSFCGLSARVKHYEQQAIVANIELATPHKQVAFERFTSQGPLALLPMSANRMSLVWALPPRDAQEKMGLEDPVFLAQLQRAFGYRAGKFLKVGRRFSYPLKQVLMQEQSKWPVVFVGNAAHTLHPVAGQGFNLGLRDVAALAQCIAKSGLTPQMLQAYQVLRKQDQQAITRLTDGLVELFTSKLPGLRLARSMGLVAFDTIPALKNLLARYARGFGGVIPDLVCEIALTEPGVQ